MATADDNTPKAGGSDGGEWSAQSRLFAEHIPQRDKRSAMVQGWVAISCSSLGWSERSMLSEALRTSEDEHVEPMRRHVVLVPRSRRINVASPLFPCRCDASVGRYRGRFVRFSHHLPGICHCGSDCLTTGRRLSRLQTTEFDMCETLDQPGNRMHAMCAVAAHPLLGRRSGRMHGIAGSCRCWRRCPAQARHNASALRRRLSDLRHPLIGGSCARHRAHPVQKSCGAGPHSRRRRYSSRTGQRAGRCLLWAPEGCAGCAWLRNGADGVVGLRPSAMRVRECRLVAAHGGSLRLTAARGSGSSRQLAAARGASRRLAAAFRGSRGLAPETTNNRPNSTNSLARCGPNLGHSGRRNDNYLVTLGRRGAHAMCAVGIGGESSEAGKRQRMLPRAPRRKEKRAPLALWGEGKHRVCFERP